MKRTASNQQRIPMTLDTLLQRLLERLESIGHQHEEIFDSEVRERMGMAIMDGFVHDRVDYTISNDMGMFSEEANVAVRSSIQEYVDEAKVVAKALGLAKFHERLAVFQNGEVVTEKDRNDYDEFFGTTPPESYDEHGTVIRLK